MLWCDDRFIWPSDYVLQKMLLSPQAERNWESLCCMLEDVLEHQSHRQLFALELGSGTGQHVIRFAQKIPFVTWQPSDITQECLDRLVFLGTSLLNLMLTSCWVKRLRRCEAALPFCLSGCSIKAYIAATRVKTVLQPVLLDASQPWQQWAGVSQQSCDVIVAINLMQYSSFKTAQVRFQRKNCLSMIKYLKTWLISFSSKFFKGVFIGAGQVLKQNGLLLTYGVWF